MSIKKRLWISHILMILIPIILSLITARIIFSIYTSSYGEVFQDDLLEEYMYTSSIINTEITKVSSENPDKLENLNYLTELESTLEDINTGIVVTKNNIPIYVSAFLNKEEELNQLLLFKDDSLKKFDRMHNNNQWYVKQQNFYFSDNSPGAIYTITNYSLFSERDAGFKQIVIIIVTMFVIILITTNTILTYLMTRYILKPLNQLKDYTNTIKKGHLAFKVTYNSKNEIGELFSAFEEMRSKLEESEELKNKYEKNRKELISNISHDLKTPVTAIKGYVEGILDGVAVTPEKINKYLNTIYNKATIMDRLIEDLFLFSKLDLKNLPFNYEQVDIKSYLEDFIEEMQFDLTEKGIKLGFHSSIDQSEQILVDRQQLKRVLINIIDNSIKHMDKENANITVTLKEQKKSFLISFVDNGKGISRKDLPLIFDRFYRADPSRNTATGGTGLGLAIAKQIIEAHEGSIWAESEEGIGTTISFTLKKGNKSSNDIGEI